MKVKLSRVILFEQQFTERITSNDILGQKLQDIKLHTKNKLN